MKSDLSTKKTLCLTLFSAKDCREKAQLMNSNLHKNLEKEREDNLILTFESEDGMGEVAKKEVSIQPQKSIWAKFAKTEGTTIQRKVLESSKEKTSSSHNYSIDHKTPVALPSHKCSVVKSSCRVDPEVEPPMKKLKAIDDDDDFTFSQDDLDFIDSLH